MCKILEVYSDESKEDITIYAYIKGDGESIESFRQLCVEAVDGGSFPKGSSILSSQLAVARDIVSRLKGSNLQVELVFADTTALRSSTKDWVKCCRNHLDVLRPTLSLSDTQKTVVSQRCTQLLPFFATSLPPKGTRIRFYPDNTGHWIDLQTSNELLDSPNKSASGIVDMKAMITMQARVLLRTYFYIPEEKLPEIELMEARTDDELLIGVADYLVNFSLNSVRRSVGCKLEETQHGKADIIECVFPFLASPEFKDCFELVEEKPALKVDGEHCRVTVSLK